MPPPTIGVGTLSRLRALDHDGRSVLSVYLEVDTATTPAVAAEELERLITGMGERVRDEHVEKMHASLRAMPALRQGTRGLAMFSSLDGSSARTIRLPAQVDALAVLDTIPWLEPLAGTFTDGVWGVAILGSDSARLFRGHPRMLVEFATVHGFDRRRVLGVCSQSSPRRVHEQHVLGHARRVAQLLLRAHRRQPFEHLVIAAPSEYWSSIEAALHGELGDRIVDLTALDLVHCSPQEIARALTVSFLNTP